MRRIESTISTQSASFKTYDAHMRQVVAALRQKQDVARHARSRHPFAAIRAASRSISD